MTKLIMKPIVYLLISFCVIGSTFAESPVRILTAKDCKDGEKFVECGTCEATCSNQSPMCTLQCRPPMCKCETGKVRHSNGKCVLPTECEGPIVPIVPPVLPPPRDNNSSQQQCGRNEILKQCSGCENQCGRPQIMCKMICNNIPKCECDFGFFRNNQTGQCVSEKECPGSTQPSQGQCKENESLKSCPGCEPTCSNPNPVCIQSCREGQECECSKGFVRNDAGKCVKLSQCPSNGNANQCKENESLKSCPGCEPTCSNPNPVCIEICREGQACECSEGFVRNEVGNCVKQTECSTSNGNGNVTKCGENERLTQCSGCEANCANLDRMCPMMCNMIPKCECASGFARNSENKCIPTAQCSNTRNPRDNGTQPEANKCRENEVLTSCPGCEPSCDNKNPICTLECRLGKECQCQKGFYRNSQGKCVTEAQCKSSQNSTSCPKNEVFMECGGCEGSCSNHNPMCTMQCRPAGCYCPVGKGFVRGPKGHCIHRSVCQKRVRDAVMNNSEEEEYNPCAATSCPVNTTCEVIKVQCVKAPCPPQVRCTPVDPSTINPCSSTLCPADTECQLKQVQCFTTPCPPIPECVPINGTRPSRSPPILDKCAVVRCMANTTCIDGKCVQNAQQNPCLTTLCPPNTVCKLNQVQCIRAPCPPIPECVPLNETRPSRSTPILDDKCAVVRCMANTTCIDGKCVQNPQQNPCATTLCPPNTVCKLNHVVCVRAPCPPIPECVPVNETRPSRSTPILDKCADIMCTADSTCVDGKCVKIDSPEQDPCALMLCGPNTRCEKVQVNCIQAPCPSQGRCVPINETQDPTVPLLTCETVDCIQGRVCRMLVTCLDQDKPCPPKPQCVPVTDDLQISDPCSLMDCRDGFKCITIRTNCVMAPCNVTPVEGKCVPMNETEVDRPDRQVPSPNDDPCATIRCRAGTECSVIMPDCIEGATDCHAKGVCVPTVKPPRPNRETNSNTDPCATMRCAGGTECTVIMPSCIEGATDCGPKGVCVSTHHTQMPPVASMPPMKDDPIQDIQNTFCMMARCTHGCITTGIKCNEDGTKCEYLGQCAPENFNETSINVCENSTCPTNKKCEEEIVQCFTTPCLPIPRCVDSTSNPSTDVCANHKCPEGQICQPHALRCNRLVKNCKSFPICVNKKQ